VRGRRRRGSREVDAEASFTIEDEGAARGYYMGLVGTFLKYTMTLLGGLLVVSSQGNPNALGFSLILVVFYFLGWMMVRDAGIQGIETYDTILDVLSYGLVLGFVIRILEAVVYSISTGGLIESLNPLSPFDVFYNVSTTGATGLIYTAVGLTFAAVGEEMLYRGGMINLISILTDNERKSFGETTATIIALSVQAFAFGLFHSAVYSQPEQLLALIVGGYAFGLIFLWRKDLSVCIIAHLTLNYSGLYPYVLDYLLANPLIGLGLGLIVGLLVYLSSFRSQNNDE